MVDAFKTFLAQENIVVDNCTMRGCSNILSLCNEFVDMFYFKTL